MAWQIDYITTGPLTYNDISSYVIELPKIPIYKANDNFAPVIHGFTFRISQTCPYTISVNSKLRVSGPTTSQIFIIKKVNTEKTNLSLSIYCEHQLCLLRDYYVTTAELSASITSTGDLDLYNPADNRGGAYNFENAQLLWVIEKMFIIAGLAYYSTNDKDKIAITHGGTNYEFEHIVIDHKMLYTINQASTASIDGGSLISFWDFIQAVCAFWGFTFFEYNGNITMLARESFNLITDNAGYSDDVLLSYQEVESEETGQVALTDIYVAPLLTNYYSGSDVASSYNLNTDVVNQTTFNWYNNLRFMLRDIAGSSGDVLMSSGFEVYFDFITNAAGLTENMIKNSIENEYVEKTYELGMNAPLLADKYYANEVSVDIVRQILTVNYKDFS